MSDTPTPTDPREERPEINTHVRLFDLVRYQRSELLHAKLITEEEYTWLCAGPMAMSPKGGSPSRQRLEDYDEIRAANSNLAAEIAELKAKLATALEQRDTRSLTALERVFEIDTLRAELEAARKELVSLEEMYQRSCERENKLQSQRNTALAAKDAAERLINALESIPRTHAIGLAPSGTWQYFGEKGNAVKPTKTARELLEAIAALTPAPTQEPPAGGVTILKPDVLDYLKSQCNRYVNGMCSTLSCMKRGGFVAGVTCDPDYSRATCQYHEAVCALTPTVSTEGGDPPCAHKEIASQDSSTPTSPDKSGNESKTTCASNSPADVPPEGRGELLPFNLSDALAGMPVVTRDGCTTSGFRRRSDENFSGYDYEVVVDGVWRSYKADGRWMGKTDSIFDLFMLPPEGSGA